MRYKEKTSNEGRSMVEMLGVIAIIGVLSAFALAGYSKAMFRHRLTQTIDAFSQVLQRFSELKGKGLDDDFKINTAEDILKYGLVSQCQKIMARNSFSSCKMPIGMLNIEAISSYARISIFLNSSKECVGFMSVQWEKIIPLEWLNDGAIEINGPDTVALDKTDLSMHELITACQNQCSGGDCEINFYLNL